MNVMDTFADVSRGEVIRCTMLGYFGSFPLPAPKRFCVSYLHIIVFTQHLFRHVPTCLSFLFSSVITERILLMWLFKLFHFSKIVDTVESGGKKNLLECFNCTALPNDSVPGCITLNLFGPTVSELHANA